MRAYLFVEGDSSQRRTYALDLGGVVLGRHEASDIVAADPAVSRRHARIYWDGSAYVLKDLGSKNGTFLNGAQVHAPSMLSHGDTITLGGMQAIFRIEGEATTDTAKEVALAPTRVDARTAEVWINGHPVRVTAKEFLVLRALAVRPGALVSKNDLACAAWPECDGAVADYNVEQLVSRLRRKIEPDARHPVSLITVRGLGYRLLTS